MFRHPLSRLVSAFLWCTTDAPAGRPTDTMCASYLAQGGNRSGGGAAQALREFARRRWGAYEATRLADHALLARECDVRPPVAAARLAAAARGGGSGGAAAGGKRSRDSAAATPSLGQLVARGLERRFAAVGLLENFSLSLRLFGAASGLDFGSAAWRDTHEHDAGAKCSVASPSSRGKIRSLRRVT